MQVKGSVTWDDRSVGSRDTACRSTVTHCLTLTSWPRPLPTLQPYLKGCCGRIPMPTVQPYLKGCCGRIPIL